MFTYSHPYGPPGMNGSASNKEKTVGSFSPELTTSSLMAQATFGQPNMLFPQYPQQQQQAAAAQFIRAQWAQWAMLSQLSAAQQLTSPPTNNSPQLSAATAAGFLPFAPPPQRPESSPTAYSDDLTGSVDSPPSSKTRRERRLHRPPDLP
uniref:Uncharacterized protein n=1 Tax=Plectus sambesii TaxID=2011161 RepID=A0A914WJC6_9BILA